MTAYDQLLLRNNVSPLDLAVHPPSLCKLVVVVVVVHRPSPPQPLLLQTQASGLGRPLRRVLMVLRAEVEPLAEPCQCVEVSQDEDALDDLGY